MKDLLDSVLTKARRHPGMASVYLYWCPYSPLGWMAKADWSDDPPEEIKTNVYADPEDALKELSVALDAKYDALRKKATI